MDVEEKLKSKFLYGDGIGKDNSLRSNDADIKKFF